MSRDFTRLPFHHFETEADLQRYTLDWLGQWFAYKEHVWGTHCSGRRLCLDAILWPHETSDGRWDWKDEFPVFGVEFKLADDHEARDFDTVNFTKWIAQTIDYAHTDWDDYGKLKIFACPSPLRHLGNVDSSMWTFIVGLLGDLGIGELTPINDHGEKMMSLILKGRFQLWNSAYGVVEGKKWKLQPVCGSR